jgi:hypothetical protein
MLKHRDHGSRHPPLNAIVSAIRSGNVIEFAFVYGDPDLSVELVLPLAAFVEFCGINHCRVAVPDDRLRKTANQLFDQLIITPFIEAGAPETHA